MGSSSSSSGGGGPGGVLGPLGCGLGGLPLNWSSFSPSARVLLETEKKLSNYYSEMNAWQKCSYAFEFFIFRIYW